METLISIVIPCYNTGSFLPKILNELIKQEFVKKRIEIILVNDGSSDNTSQIAQSFVEKYPYSIKLIEKENEGVSVARNVGIENSKGKYIVFLDSDDLLNDDTLDYYINILSTVEADLFVFGYELIKDGHVEKVYQTKIGDKKLCSKEEFEKLFFFKKVPAHICGCIFKRNFIVDNSIFFTKGRKIGEDMEFIIKAIFNSKSVYYDNRICYLYCLRDNSAMAGYKKYNHSDSLECQSSLIEQYGIKENVRYYNYWLCYLYISKVIGYLKMSNGDDSFVKYYVENKKYLKEKRKRELKVDVAACFFSICSIKFLFNIFSRKQ